MVFVTSAGMWTQELGSGHTEPASGNVAVSTDVSTGMLIAVNHVAFMLLVYKPRQSLFSCHLFKSPVKR